MSETNTQFTNRTPETMMDVSFEMARLRVSIDSLLNYTEGTLIELDKIAGEPFDVRVNNMPFGKGEPITVNEVMGIRFTEIFSQE